MTLTCVMIVTSREAVSISTGTFLVAKGGTTTAVDHSSGPGPNPCRPLFVVVHERAQNNDDQQIVGLDRLRKRGLVGNIPRGSGDDMCGDVVMVARVHYFFFG